MFCQEDEIVSVLTMVAWNKEHSNQCTINVPISNRIEQISEHLLQFLQKSKRKDEDNMITLKYEVACKYGGEKQEAYCYPNTSMIRVIEHAEFIEETIGKNEDLERDLDSYFTALIGDAKKQIMESEIKRTLREMRDMVYGVKTLEEARDVKRTLWNAAREIALKAFKNENKEMSKEESETIISTRENAFLLQKQIEYEKTKLERLRESLMYAAINTAKFNKK